MFVVGPNGAGKTTLLRTISGLVSPVSGEIWLGSAALTGRKPWDIVTAGVSHVPQNRRCFGPLSVEENLLMGGYGRGKAELKAALAAVYDVFPALVGKRKQKAQELSGGQQQMVAIGRALMGNAKLIMLDEPSLGLAPALVDNLGRTLRRVRDELGTAVLLVEQNVQLGVLRRHPGLHAADRHADRRGRPGRPARRTPPGVPRREGQRAAGARPPP